MTRVSNYLPGVEEQVAEVVFSDEQPNEAEATFRDLANSEEGEYLRALHEAGFE